jgi:OOP family OmpA-OmpF porin
MEKFGLIVLVFCVQIGLGQVTENPKIAKKSSSDTFIKKIEITDSYTVVSMQFTAKPAEELIKDYLNANPGEKEQLSRMNPMMRNMLLQQMMQQMSGSSISIQPKSYLKAPDGRKFEFVKASDIPVSPERKQVNSGEKYAFKVYFKKLDKGIRKIDLIENEQAEADGFSYWNFFGIEINNPGEGEKPIVIQEEKPEAITFTLSGKVYDTETNTPLSARIICLIDGESVPFDSVSTSRSGYFEFILTPASFVYQITAPGYKTYEQALDLTNWKKDLHQDFYLEPLNKADLPEGESTESLNEFDMTDSRTIRLNHVYFPTGKAEIINNSYRELDKLVEFMKSKPEVKIRVDGHTDNQGDAKQNKLLSIDRAKAVRDYLVAKGIEPIRIEFKGWGDTQPIEQNETEQSRQKNRRVEVVILTE